MESWGCLTRRAALAGAAAATVGTSGCLGRVQSTIDRTSPEQVSLSILTVPADDDRIAVRIARHLALNLEAAGIAADVVPTTPDKLLREVLVNHTFDIFVGRHQGQHDPDFLRPFLHSQFVEEGGWQNPFGYANLTVDDLLERQRSVRHDRAAVLAELQRVLALEHPFTVVAFPVEPRVVSGDRFGDGRDVSLSSPLGYVVPGAGVGDRETLRVGTTDRRSTRNLNPLAVEYRDHGIVTGLLYDPLAYTFDGEYVPWLAAEWTWLAPSTARYPTLSIELRDGLTWHDGTPLTASDVAFTYRFLTDTTMTDGDPVVPTPRFRGRTSLVSAVEAIDRRHLRIQFVASNREVARTLLTVPILPEHVWTDRSGITEVAGIELQARTTEALVWENTDPVGSGPFRIEEVATDDRVLLSRFDDHFLGSIEEDTSAASFRGGPPYSRLEFRIAPSQANLVEFVLDDELDATAIGVTRDQLDRVDGRADVEILTERSTRFYYVGYNARNPQLGNPRFRQAVSRLLDREYLLDDVFLGYARPSISPLVDEAVVPSDLDWSSATRYGFAGMPGSGEIRPDVARGLFQDAGYHYSADGELLVQPG